MTQAENLASQSAREIFGLPGRLGRRLQIPFPFIFTAARRDPPNNQRA